MDSGILNPALNADEIGPEAARVWEKSRIRDRIKAIIAHEDLESQGVPHDEVVQRVPETDLPIGDNARRILRTTAEGFNRQKLR